MMNLCAYLSLELERLLLKCHIQERKKGDLNTRNAINQFWEGTEKLFSIYFGPRYRLIKNWKLIKIQKWKHRRTDTG